MSNCVTTETELGLSAEDEPELRRLQEETNGKHDHFDKLEKDFLKRKLIRPFRIYLDRLNELSKKDPKLLDDERNVGSIVKKSTSSKRKTLGDDKASRKRVKSTLHAHQWINKTEKLNNKTFYSSAEIGCKTVHVGDFVILLGGREIGLIKYMWENGNKMMCHLHCFVRSCDTILGDVGFDQEIFESEDCADISSDDIDETVHVDMISFGDTFQTKSIIFEWKRNKAGLRNTFMCQKRYDNKSAEFRDLLEEDETPNDCSNCHRRKELENREIPFPRGTVKYDQRTQQYIFETIRWRDENFGVGSCIFLNSGTLIKFETPLQINPEEETYDEVKYPEKYRKKFTRKEENIREEEPFDVGYILKIYSGKCELKKTEDVCLLVKKFYRPHNTCLERTKANQMRLNLLYWSEEECSVKLDQAIGKCFVAYENNLQIPVDEWSAAGPYRFYFSETYDNRAKRFLRPSKLAIDIGNCKTNNVDENVPFDWPKISRPLRTMDVFAGCGGFSAGLHEAGVAKCLWAVEKVQEPANAFKLNCQEAEVYTEDCNLFLKKKMLGDKTGPQKGDVELMCGGPPCQGFTRMNRFRERICSTLKNSLITTYLSFCDHYRPRFFILENVSGFVSNQKNAVLRTTMGCLLLMGYQVSFGVLQCGKYGVPQNRRRVIILAAAPGEILPNFPEPTHTFPSNSSFSVPINNKRYEPALKWITSAPYRGLTVYDAISDLPKPKISNRATDVEMSYKSEPLTHFQLKMRETNSRVGNKLRDHVCKNLPPLTVKRVEYIPRKPVGDWRDLPNIEVVLANGKVSRKLKYTHHDSINGKSENGELRGVCICATSPLTKCDVQCRQKDTLIPWCLPHTSNRHNHWRGLYGRLGWDSVFKTVVTNPEPMSKQGCVLHPEEDRVVSVRECARAQGFPDSFKFSGTVMEKYAQVGNAVAPPFAKNIGLEIRKSVAKRPELLL